MFKHIAGTIFGLTIATAVTVAVAGNGGQLTGGGLTRVVHGTSMTGSGTSTSALDVAASGVSAGSYTSTNLTVGADGRVTSASNGTAGVAATRQIIAGTGLSGGGDLSADRTISLANTTVTPGSYTYASLIVDAQGRLTAASNGSTPALASTAMNAGTGLTGGGDLSANRTFALANTAVTPSSYTYSSITVDAQGRLTSASSGATPVPATRTLTGTAPITIDGGTSADLSANRTIAIATNGVGYTLQAQAAASTFSGNNTGGTANKIDMTVSQARTLLGLATVATSGLASDLTGTLAAAQLPALTGDVTSSAGSATTTIAAHAVTYAKQAQAAANTISGNNTGGTADRTDLTTTQVVTMLASQIAAQLTAGSGYFGDGTMGTATFDGAGAVTGTTRTGSTYKANQDLFFTTCTFSASVVLDLSNGTCGFGLYCNNTLAGPGSGTATIQANGNAGSGGTAGAALTSASPIGCTSGAGSGGIQNAGQAGGAAQTWQNSFKAGNGGASGASATNAGAVGGTVGSTLTDAQASTGDYPVTWWARVINGTGYTLLSGGGGGASGGGTTGIAAGGGGGGGGGYCRVAARTITNASAFTLSAAGGRGSDGVAALGSNAGGGGGGGGGYVLLRYGGSTAPAGITLTAAGGGGGSPQGTGNAGSSGTAGQTRTYLLGVSN